MIEIEIHSRPVLDAFNRLIALGSDLHPVMDAIGNEMVSRTSARFETKTDPSGAPWAQWKPSTVKSYPKDGNKKLLDRYNDMLGSLSHQVDSDSSVRIGFGQPYAKWHELGTGKMDRRGMLTADPVAKTLGADDEDAVLGILRAALQNALEG